MEKKGVQKQWKCNLGITWGPCLRTCFTPLVSQSSLNSPSSWKNFTSFFFWDSTACVFEISFKEFLPIHRGAWCTWEKYLAHTHSEIALCA